MHLYIIRLFIVLGLFFSPLAPAVTSTLSVANGRVFAYAEANYPDIFQGRAGDRGIYRQYEYRFYPDSGNYLGIDPMGNIAILGPHTGNELKPVGNVSDHVSFIIDWEVTQPLTPRRVFDYAETHFPDLFSYIVDLSIQLLPEDITYRCYSSDAHSSEDTGNCLGIDEKGEIFIKGLNTDDLMISIGNVADYESAIRAWESPNLRLDYPGFTIWLDCSKRGPVKFHYEAKPGSDDTPRSDSDFLDPEVPADCQQTSVNAYGMDYEKGHLVPVKHLGTSAEAIKAANVMINILPQAANMNKGAWSRTEEIIECHGDTDELEVTGGVIWGRDSADDHFTRSHGIETPDAFWKVIVKGEGQNQQSIAWIIPNSQEATWDRLDQYLVSVSEVELRTGQHIPVAGSGKDKPASQSWAIPSDCNKSRKTG